MRIVTLRSDDSAFLNLYQQLANALGDRRVYVEHQVIPPEARVAIRMPDHVLVLLSEPDIDIAGDIIDEWLARGEDRVVEIDHTTAPDPVTVEAGAPNRRDRLNTVLRSGSGPSGPTAPGQPPGNL